MELLLDAAGMSAIAAVVDYGITPKRLTPGWKLILSKGAIGGAFASLAISLVAGAMVCQERALTESLLNIGLDVRRLASNGARMRATGARR